MAIEVLDKYKTFEDEIYRWIIVYDENIPEFCQNPTNHIEKFFKSDMGMFVEERAKGVERSLQENVVSPLIDTNIIVCCFMKEADIAYMSLKYA